MNRNEAGELFEAYTQFLLREGYVDDDVWCEGESTIDKFMNTKWFRAGIELQEKRSVVTIRDLKRIDEAREERSTINNRDFFDNKLTSKYKRK